MRSGAETLFASAARTATSTSGNQTRPEICSGAIFVIDITAGDSGFSVVFAVQGVDPLSGKTWTILTSAAKVAVGTTILRVYPGLTPAANVTVSDVIPSAYNVVATHADGKSITYSVSSIPVA